MTDPDVSSDAPGDSSATPAWTAPRPPAWVRAADAVSVGAFVLGIFVVLFGGFALHLGPAPLRVHSPAPLLFVAVALIVLRHVAHPGHPLHRRLAGALRSAADGTAVAIAPAAMASRIGVLLIGYFAVVTIGIASQTAGVQSSGDPALNLPSRFDSGWYAGVALEGYSFQGRFDRQQNVAFFPAYPMLMRAAGYPLGAFAPAVPKERRIARLLWGGVILSLLAFTCAAVYFWRLARDTIGESRATDAVMLLAAYPFAIFFSAAYTESVFLLGSVAAFYHFRRDEFLPAAGWGLLVGLTRPNGCFLSVALACLVAERLWRRRSDLRDTNYPIVRSLLSASASGVGMLAYSAYVHWLTGAWFGWARLHEAWGRSYEGLAPVTRAYGWIADEGLLHVVEGVPYDTLNALGLIFALLLLWPVWRKLGTAYAVFVLINIVPPMLAGGVLSMGRLTSTVFPLFLALALVASKRAVTPLVTAFAIAQGLAAALFFTWRPLF